MTWNILAESKLVEHLGWTLVNSLWQIAVVSAALLIALRLIRQDAANKRYAASVLALALSLALPVATFLQVSGSSDVAGVSSGIERPDELGQFDEFGHRRDRIPSVAGIRGGNQQAASDNAFQPLAGLKTFIDQQFPAAFPFAVGLWLVGIALFSFRLTGGLWKLHHYKTQGIEPLNREWQDRFSNLCKKLGVTTTVQLLRSNLVSTPIAVGIIKPLIIVPASIFFQMDPRQLESIIAHELIHIRRYDPLINIIQSVAEVALFYHPGVWWISRQIRREREFAADAAVMESFVDGSVVYATALADLEEIRLLANETAPSMAMAANGGNLMLRIERILHKKTEISRANSAWSAGLALVLISALLLAVFSFTPQAFVNAQQRSKDRKIAIGFVSIPPLDRTENPPKDSDATARLMIAKLQQYKIPAVGFVQGSMISDGNKLYPVRANIVRLWRDAGLEVGIGNFKHIWFYNTPYDEYVAGVETNEGTVKKILAEKNLPLRYFSYPYLNTGKSTEERDRFERWLNDRGLKSVKYTIDNNEWMYSYAYDMARNDNDVSTMNEVRVAFIKYMDKMFDHYEAYSQELFGRDIPQTMVLTPSRLVVDSADDLFGMIGKRGYSFVSMDDALADVAYKTPETFVGNSGISWFERWTLAQGKRLRDEPKIDEAVQKIWEERSAKK